MSWAGEYTSISLNISRGVPRPRPKRTFPGTAITYLQSAKIREVYYFRITFFPRQGVFERKNARRTAGGLSESEEQATLHHRIQFLLKVDHSSRSSINRRCLTLACNEYSFGVFSVICDKNMKSFKKIIRLINGKKILTNWINYSKICHFVNNLCDINFCLKIEIKLIYLLILDIILIKCILYLTITALYEK